MGGVAQLGEHLLCKQGVRSSILLSSTKIHLFRAECAILCSLTTISSNKVNLILNETIIYGVEAT